MYHFQILDHQLSNFQEFPGKIEGILNSFLGVLFLHFWVQTMDCSKMGRTDWSTPKVAFASTFSALRVLS